MLSDKEMALDALESTKVGATELTKAAAECSNQSLRQSLIQMRNQCETAQQQLGNMAISNNWYMPASQANHNEVNQVLQFYRQGSPMTNMNVSTPPYQPGPRM